MKTQFGRTLMVVASAAMAVAYVGGIGSSAAAVAAGKKGEAHARLDRTIHQAMRAEGPFFTQDEQAVISAKCGYAPGEWDGYDVNMSNDMFICRNGKRIDDPEMRALLKNAEPRIARKVNAAMQSAAVKDAIGAVAADATREAMADLAKKGWPFR